LGNDKCRETNKTVEIMANTKVRTDADNPLCKILASSECKSNDIFAVEMGII